MDINAFNAAQTYGSTRKLLTPESAKPDVAKTGVQSSSQDDGFHPEKLVQDMAKTISRSENVAAEYMAGRADPHSVVEALASAELAVETAVTLRNKVVEAYQELMRMPV